MPKRSKDQTPRKKTSLALPPELHMRAKLYSVRAGIDLQDIVVEALEAYLKKHKA